MTRRPALVLASPVLASALLLGGLSGCGSEDAKPAAASASSAAATAATAKLVTAGLEQITAGKTAAAKATFESVLVLDANNPFAHYNLGFLAQQDDDTTTALQEYDAALKAAPDFTSALYNKAYLLEETDLDEAIALYRKVTAIKPDDAAAHMRLGFALLHQGETSAGEAELGTGIKLDPSMANVSAPEYADSKN